ncbi:MAG: aromatic ring-hydroxylating dioxygenase subunit alpha [Betaproteobacteria bacterium]|nr:aromatic ring-hydroxylating dioxygenase subunit alpha [Betaproteobacteria bacterium]
MISTQQNERLTRVGPGTPGGELLRRYWQPLCPAAELTAENPKKRIRIMGENLLVFRDTQGGIGCVEEFCKHRGISLYYGFVEEDGIRCCYHGWKYDLHGRCKEQPFEPAKSTFKDEIRLKAYPVQSLGGLLFVYMGPDPERAPLLPRWDVLVREDGKREIKMFPTHYCNWVQIQENTADSTHTFFLHGIMDRTLGLKHPFAPYYRRPIEKLEFSTCEWGIDKVIVYGGDVPETEIRPPLIFPNILRIPNGPVEVMHWRVPIDDTSTRIAFVAFTPSPDAAVRTRERDTIPYVYLPPMKTPEGEYDLKSFFSQDQMAQETQGAIYDRANENLGTSDRGIVLFRKMLLAQIARVEKGQDPTVAVVQNPERNVMIGFPNITSPVAGLKRIVEMEKTA